MIQPERAPVTPRVQWPETGDAVPIDEVFACLEEATAEAIEIAGEPGAGKTTALKHLAASAPPRKEIIWIDDADPDNVARSMADGWVIYTTRFPAKSIHPQRFRLAGWAEDDWVEYLLAVHPAECRSVMSRLAAAGDRSALGDSPLVVADRARRNGLA